MVPECGLVAVDGHTSAETNTAMDVRRIQASVDPESAVFPRACLVCLCQLHYCRSDQLQHSWLL